MAVPWEAAFGFAWRRGPSRWNRRIAQPWRDERALIMTVRGGSYWEPGRIAGADGRLHVTAGLEWRFWQFRFRSDPYRLRFSITADVARDYRNGGVSMGLWH